MGTRKNRLNWYSLERLIEAVLTCTHDLCFEQKIRKISQFYSSDILQFVALACFRNDKQGSKLCQIKSAIIS